MKIVGITGNSGSGKSTVSEILKKQYGFKIIDADKVVKRLSKKGTKYFADIVNTFGIGILSIQAEINTKKLGRVIFSNPEKRKLLNSLTFKHVKEEIEKQALELSKNSLVAIDAPLLFESKLNEICDFTIGLIAGNEYKLERIIKRDKISPLDAKKRLNAQADDEYYKEKCSYIIENNGGIEQVEKQIEEIFKKEQ